MELLFGLVIPIVVVVLTYSKAQYEKKRQTMEYNQLITKAAKEIMEEVKRLSPPKDC